MQEKIKILVVDSSVLMRKKLSDIINSDPKLEVVATAANGTIALQRIKEHGPDLVFLNINLSDDDGILVLKKIMKEWPLPVILLSSQAEKDNDKIMDSLDAGAIDFIQANSDKPIESITEEINFKIISSAFARINQYRKKAPSISIKKFAVAADKIVVIASSTGGPQTLEYLLHDLPSEFPSPILIVQHMPKEFTKSFAQRLNRICDIEIREAKDGDSLLPGVALIAPGDHHMEIDLDTKKIRLNKKPKELGVRPCANFLFTSVATLYGKNTIGIVLTGMGSDGKKGSKEIKKYSGTVIAEAEESCIIFGMPKEVINAGLADEVVTLEKMAVALLQLVEA